MKKVGILVAAATAALVAIGAVGIITVKAAPAVTATVTSFLNGPGTDTTGDRSIHEYMEENFAKALGLTLAQFDAQEDAGKTWADIATAQGKTAAEAQTLLNTAYTDAIAQALKDGKITQAQADTLKTATPPTLANMGSNMKGDPTGDRAVHEYMEENFAKALGLSLADFDTQEAAGKSWADIATSQGKSATDAQNLLNTAYTDAIAQALKDGKITQAQADTLKAATPPTLATVGMPGHGQPGGDGAFPGGHHGGHGRGPDNNGTSTGATATPTTTNP